MVLKRREGEGLRKKEGGHEVEGVKDRHKCKNG